MRVNRKAVESRDERLSAFVQEGEATYENYRKFTVETRESVGSIP